MIKKIFTTHTCLLENLIKIHISKLLMTNHPLTNLYNDRIQDDTRFYQTAENPLIPFHIH